MLLHTFQHAEKKNHSCLQSVNRPVWSRVEKLKTSVDICFSHQVSFGRSNREEMDGRDMWGEWENGVGKLETAWKALILSFMEWDETMDWIDLAQDITRWLALVNSVTMSEFYQMRWSSCVAEELSC